MRDINKIGKNSWRLLSQNYTKIWKKSQESGFMTGIGPRQLNNPGSHKDHIHKVETFYSENESETDKVEVFYSDDEKDLGAADEEDSSDSEEEDQPQRKPEPRWSGRSWAPTQRVLESQGQQWDFRRTGHIEGFGTTLPCLPPERQPIDQEPEDDNPAPAEERPIDAPTVGIGQEDLNLEPTPEDNLDDLVLEPVLDHRGRRLDPAAEGVGEPDPLVLARSPATMRSATQLLIPRPRERAQTQDQDAVLSVVKDWVRRGTVSGRLELDFGDSQLKAYVKVIPVLRLCQMPDQKTIWTDLWSRLTSKEENSQKDIACQKN